MAASSGCGFPSLFDMLDLVQVLSDRMGQMAAFDEDAIHWIGVAVRESVINAIKHGNREHPAKLVTIEFAFTPIDDPTELVVSVTDQGEGFEPEAVADPLAPENILKSSGRGIFFMRSFMDDVQLSGAPGGRHGGAHGEEAGGRWLSRSPRVFLATAIQAVIKAGAMQMAGIDHSQVEKGRHRSRHPGRSRGRAACSAR